MYNIINQLQTCSLKLTTIQHTLKNYENELVIIKGQVITCFKMRTRHVHEVESSRASCE
jgi:hypothetical protein